jgi:hypothetical protein
MFANDKATGSAQLKLLRLSCVPCFGCDGIAMVWPTDTDHLRNIASHASLVSVELHQPYPACMAPAVPTASTVCRAAAAATCCFVSALCIVEALGTGVWLYSSRNEQ